MRFFADDRLKRLRRKDALRTLESVDFQVAVHLFASSQYPDPEHQSSWFTKLEAWHKSLQEANNSDSKRPNFSLDILWEHIWTQFLETNYEQDIVQNYLRSLYPDLETRLIDETELRDFVERFIHTVLASAGDDK